LQVPLKVSGFVLRKLVVEPEDEFVGTITHCSPPPIS
jgi:hypothetical protein